MTGETVSFEQAATQAAADGSADAKREQSTILFPYLDLDAGVDVAQHMFGTGGTGTVEAHELAAQMGQTISGAFRLKTGTARIFELTEKDGRNGTKLSELGRLIIEDDTARAARAEAFMRVPLYAAIYDKYKGQRLPPMKALEREMQALGVSSKQTDKARQAFERSARQAGYFEHGDDRLVRPRAELPTGTPRKADEGGAENRNVDPPANERNQGDGGNGGGGGDYHPLIQGLLVTLPKIGQPWPERDRKAWLTMAESIFAMIYQKAAEVNRPSADPSNEDLLG